MLATTLRRTVEEWLSKDDGQPAIALRAAAEWNGGPVFTVTGTRVRIVHCPTPLAARAALHDRAGTERLVLLTALTDDDLGDALLAQLSQHTVKRVDVWTVVENLFGGVRLESGIRQHDWLGEALIDFAPATGWTRAAGTLVTREHALRCLAAQVFGIPRDSIDVAGLLEWSGNLDKQERFGALAEPVRSGLARYLDKVAGLAAGPIMAAATARHGVDAIPLGLLAAVLWPSGVDTPGLEVMVARARLEPRFGGKPWRDNAMRAFAAAAEAWLDRADDGYGSIALDRTNRAETIAREIGADALLGSSSRLPAGFRRRMHTFADALRLAIPRGGQALEAAVARAETALRALEGHRAAEPARLKRARMAVRLLRWLSTPDSVAPQTLYAALHRQVREDGWVDRARLAVMAGDPDIGDAYSKLHQAVDNRRSLHDLQFARLLAADTAADAEPGRLLRVEDVLSRVVVPMVSAKRRVLLVLLDGMGAAAAAELAESLTGGGSWHELTLDGDHRSGVLAALPTVTRASRCSLFSGKIAAGEKSEELRGIAAALPGAHLLHKGGLRSGAGWMLPQDLIDEVQGERPVVAAVINTIDDALDRSDPGTAEWTEDRLNDLRALLSISGDRVVVLVSDHGHVVDRGADAVTLPSSSSENRWRPADRDPGEGEILLAGLRVALGGGRIVVPWREEIRYGARKAGYHGGASAAEAVIPLIVLTNGEQPIPGWAPAPVASPAWWREPVIASVPSIAPSRRSTAPGQESLFEAAPAPVRESRLADAVLASEVYQARDTGQLAGDRVRALLDALIRAPQQRLAVETLAEQAGVPAHRIRGTITALRRVLQVEGYPVLTLDPDGESVKLDLTLLREQFGVTA